MSKFKKGDKVRVTEGNDFGANKNNILFVLEDYSIAPWVGYDLPGEILCALNEDKMVLVTEQTNTESERYRQILNSIYKTQELTKDDFNNTLMHFAELIKLNK
jgi:hypothetical protein